MKFGLIENLNMETLLEDLLAVKERYPSIPDNMFNLLISLDPTFEKEKDKLGTYGKWILDKYKAGTVTDYDLGHITDALKRFDSEKKHLKNKDIYQFKTLSDIDNYLDDENSYRELSHRQEVRQRQKDRRDVDLDKEADHVFSGDGFDIWVPLTYAASCKLGQGSSWCTASTENDYYYNSYKEEYGGEYWILISQDNPEEKYQFHFESGQFMDKDDRWISIYQFLRDHQHIKAFFSRALLFGDISPESLADVYTILTEEDKKKFNAGLVKRMLKDDDYVPITIEADDISNSEYNFTDLIIGDIWEWFDWNNIDYVSAKTYYVDDIEESVKSSLVGFGFPKDLYEKIRDDEDSVEIFNDKRDGDYFEDNEDMIESFKDALTSAVDEGQRVGSESDALEDFKKALKRSIPTGTRIDPEENIFSGKDSFWLDVFPTFFTEGGMEEITEELDDTSIIFSEFDLSDIKDMIINSIQDQMKDNFREPRYGWNGFDKETFNEKLVDELYERFGYRENNEI